MKALVFEKPYHAVLKEMPYPSPGPGEVTIQVKNVGICGTDLHIYKGEFISPYPIIPGHEFSGVVYELGEGVTGLKIGDRVCVDPSLFCGECAYCLTNRGNQCENWGALGNTVNGSMAEYVSVPSKNVFKMPDSMSFEEGALIEPMACVVHAMNRLQLKVGQRVILFGAGAMGQLLVQSLAKAGASELVVVDISQKKLNMALDWGATKAYLSKDLDQVLIENPHGFDVVIDATGIPQVIQRCFDFMGPTAKYLQFGVTALNDSIKISSFKLYNKDWTLIGSMAINHTFLPALHWVKEGRIKVTPLITNTLSLDEAVHFFERPSNPDNLKVQIKVS